MSTFKDEGFFSLNLARSTDLLLLVAKQEKGIYKVNSEGKLVGKGYETKRYERQANHGDHS